MLRILGSISLLLTAALAWAWLQFAAADTRLVVDEAGLLSGEQRDRIALHHAFLLSDHDIDYRLTEIVLICCFDTIRRHEIDKGAKRTYPNPTLHKALLNGGHVDRLMQFHYADCAQAADIGDMIEVTTGFQPLFKFVLDCCNKTLPVTLK